MNKLDYSLQLDIKLSVKLHILCINTYMNNNDTKNDIAVWFENDLVLWMNNDQPLMNGGYNKKFISYIMRHYSFCMIDNVHNNFIIKNNQIRNKVYDLATLDIINYDEIVYVKKRFFLWSLLNAQEKLAFYKYIALQYGDKTVHK